MSGGGDGVRGGQPVYLYCLIRSERGRPFAADRLKTHGMGNENGVIRTIGFEDLAFVASDCYDVRYDASRDNTIRHQKVIEEVMERGFSPLPVKFGTVATATEAGATEERVRRVLNRRFGEFQGLLGDMEDKTEVGLKVFWNKERLFADIVAEYPRLRALRDRIARRPSSGLAWRDERIQLGTMVGTAIEDKRSRETPDLVRRLRPVAYDYRTNKILTDTMVLNGAFLVYVYVPVGRGTHAGFREEDQYGWKHTRRLRRRTG